MEKNNYNSDDDKVEWPGWGNKRFCDNHCPCCQYVEEKRFEVKNAKICDNCPLISIWPMKLISKSHTQNSPCIYSGSPYYSFTKDNGTIEDARKIWEECEKLLKEME